MNPNANSSDNNNTVQSPAPTAEPAAPAPTATTPPPRRGLFQSSLGIPIVLLALVGVVFGVTLIAQYALKPKTEAVLQQDAEPPLRFFTATRAWNPLGSSVHDKLFPVGSNVQDKMFPGFYEQPSPTLHPAAFWFENRNLQSVTMELNTKKGLSCSSCSAGRMAPIPPAVTRQILHMEAISVLPQGLFNGLHVGMVGPAANLEPRRLEWQEFAYKDVEFASYKIPAADNADGWSPQWGIFELLFQVSKPGPSTLQAIFKTQIDGAKEIGSTELGIGYAGCLPFEVYPPRIELGEVTDETKPITFEVIVYSKTRGASRTGPGDYGDLGVPTAPVNMPPGVSGNVGAFVTVSEPVRVPEKDLWPLTEELVKTLRVPVRAEAAYRMTVTFSPRPGDSRIDLGPFERNIDISVPGVSVAEKIEVRGLVTGRVKLDNNRTDILIPAYRAADGYVVDVKLTTDDPNAELKVIKGECSPPFLEVSEPKKLDGSGTRGHYTMRLTVPKNSRAGTWVGMVVLEVKVGTTTQRMRIPVKKS